MKAAGISPGDVRLEDDVRFGGDTRMPLAGDACDQAGATTQVGALNFCGPALSDDP